MKRKEFIWAGILKQDSLFNSRAVQWLEPPQSVWQKESPGQPQQFGTDVEAALLYPSE